MDWLDSPPFVGVRDAALEDLRRKEFHFRKVGAVVFLCGGSSSVPRERLKEYLQRTQPTLLVFYAEAAWEVITRHDKSANALKMEGELATLADIVIVIVESPGTFAELGAFANSPPLRSKLLPFLSQEHRDSESFISTGPVRWVDSDSHFAPSIWTRLDQILDSVDQLGERLGRISAEPARRIPDLGASRKHQLFFVCDLVTVFGPCPASHIAFYVTRITPSPIDVPLMLGLATALGLVSSFRHDEVDLFFRPLDGNGALRSFQFKKRYIDIPRLRAKVLSAIQRSEAGRKALDAMSRQDGAG